MKKTALTEWCLVGLTVLLSTIISVRAQDDGREKITASNIQRLKTVGLIGTGDLSGDVISWSSDSHTLFAGSSIGVLAFDMRDPASPPDIRVLGSNIGSVVTNAKGTSIAFDNGTDIHIWKADFSTELSVLRASNQDTTSITTWVSTLAFNADGTLLVSESGGNYGGATEVALWNVPTGKKVKVWANQTSECGFYHAVFSADSNLLAVTGLKHQIHIRNNVTGQESNLQTKHEDCITGIGFSADMHYAYSSGADGSVQRTEIHTGDTQILLGGLKPIYGIALSSSNDQFATVDQNGAVALWDANTSKRIFTWSPDTADVAGLNFSLAFSPDGTRLAYSRFSDDRLRIFDTKLGTEIIFPQGSTSRDNRAWFSADGNEFLTSYTDAKLWDIKTGKLLQPKDKLVIYDVFFGGAAPILLSVPLSRDGLQVWDLKTNAVISNLENSSKVETAVFSPDGSMIAATTSDSKILLWDAKTGVITLTTETTIPIKHLKFSFTGDVLAGDDGKDTIYLWDVATGNQVRALKSKLPVIQQFAFSPNSKIIAVASFDEVRLLAIANGSELGVMQIPDAAGFIECLTFSPDGTLVAAGGGYDTPQYETLKGALWVWDASTYRLLGRLEDARRFIGSISFNPSGTLIVSTRGSDEEPVRLWGIQ